MGRPCGARRDGGARGQGGERGEGVKVTEIGVGGAGMPCGPKGRVGQEGWEDKTG